MAKKARNYGVNDIINWKFDDIPIPQEWKDHIGEISDGFRMIIHGKSGHGKTEYNMQVCKMFAIHYGKVSLNNVEQGRSKTLQAAAIRNKLNEIPAGKFTLCDPSQRNFDVWFKRLSGRNSGRFIVLDSLDYMKLTVEQFKKLHEKFKKKNIIIVAWDDPADPNFKKIRYMCDIKVKVHNFKAKIRSRFGGNKTWTIWENAENANYDTVPAQKKLNDREFESEYVDEEEEGLTPTLSNGEGGVGVSVEAASKPVKKAKQQKVKQELIRVEDYMNYKVLMYEDQPEQLTVETAAKLFEQYSEVKSIHELHEVWGGRWDREGTFELLKEQEVQS